MVPLEVMRASTPPLAGRGIVITRPLSQAAGLESLIAQNGGRPILLPTIEILEVEDRSALDAVVDRLDSYDLAIFISPTAVANFSSLKVWAEAGRAMLAIAATSSRRGKAGGMEVSVY